MRHRVGLKLAIGGPVIMRHRVGSKKNTRSFLLVAKDASGRFFVKVTPIVYLCQQTYEVRYSPCPARIRNK